MLGDWQTWRVIRCLPHDWEVRRLPEPHRALTALTRTMIHPCHVLCSIYSSSCVYMYVNACVYVKVRMTLRVISQGATYLVYCVLGLELAK